MPSLTTLGVKVQPQVKERLKVAAMRLSSRPHAIHKYALVDFLGRLERGEIRDLLGEEDEQA